MAPDFKPIPLVDYEKNSVELNIAKDVYLRILRSAVLQTKADIPAMESAFQQNDFAKLQEISHRWKGDFDNLRIAPLSQVAKQMNDITRSTKDKSQLTRLFIQFRQTFSDLERSLGPG